MFYVLQNESTAALRRVPILLTDAATGTTAQAGVSTASIYPYVAINGGAFIGGTGPVFESGFGQYVYQMHPAETATLGLAGIHITAPGCRNYDAIVQIAALNVYSSAGLGLTAGDVWEYDISAISSAGLAGKQLNDAATGGSGISAADVWNYVLPINSLSAELTLNNADVQTQTAQLSNSVWNIDISTYTSPSAGYDLTQAASGGAGLTVGDVSDAVWNAQTGSYEASGSFGLAILRSDNAGIAGSVTVWTGAALNGVMADAYRIDGSYDASTALKDVLTGIGSSITGNITGNLSGSVGSVTSDVNVSTASMSGIAGTVWNTDVSAFTSPSAGYDLTQAALGGGGVTAGDVWSYATRTITGGIADTVTSVTNPVSITDTSMAGVANTVWSTLTAPYTTHATFGHQILRSDNAATIGEVTLHQSGGSKRVDADVHAFVNSTASATAMLNILTGIGASMTTNITGSVSGSVGSVTSPVSVATASMTGIAGTVWSVATRTITGGTITTVSDKTGYSLSGTQSFNLTGNITGNLSGSVGSVTSAVSLSTATQASIANSVWLTDITSFTAPSAGEDLATAAVGGISPADVWTYASRTITGGIADTVTTLTNRAGFAITGGTITTVSDKTGYSLSSPQTFNLTGNITGNVSGSVGSVSGAVGSVTGSVGSVAGNVVGSVASVTAPVSISTASMGSIGSTVWNYVLSDTQTADANLVSAGSGGVAITAGDIWSYNTRTLTSGAGITVIGAVQLVNGPYRLTSNQNNSDGVLDILQNSVQEINLNLIDGNGSPASTAGYASIVNIYDVAGVAVTTYSPVVEYADGGVLNFELDTDVTATIGRYNLIVGLSGAGFNVKYGPLQILVRPL